MFRSGGGRVLPTRTRFCAFATCGFINRIWLVLGGLRFSRTYGNREHQQRRAALRTAVPSTNSKPDTAIQWLSAVLGSDEEVAVAALGLEVLTAVLLVTVVVVTVLVAAAGFRVGFVDGSVTGSPVAGSVPGADGPSPGTSGPPVSPADAVASTGSIVTCAATDPSASTTPPAPKAPPAGTTKRADVSDPPRQATPPSAPDASS